MTAEVAVINRSAVALAADSAVTIGDGSSTKIFQSANKLFELSDKSPVGIMIYSSASYYGIPWELIVKEFRFHNANWSGSHVFDWKSRFLSFIKENFKPSYDMQFSIFKSKSDTVFSSIKNKFFTELAKIKFDENVEEDSIKQQFDDILDGLISEHITLFETEMLEENINDEVNKFVEDISEPLKEYFIELFEGYPDLHLYFEELLKLSRAIISSKKSLGNNTGIIIAGYGDDELFPSLCHFVVDGCYGDFFKEYDIDKYDVSRNENTGTTFAFAQPDVADQFLFGINQSVEAQIIGFYTSCFKTLSEIILETDGLTSKQASTIKEHFKGFPAFMNEKYVETYRGVILDDFYSDVEKIVKLMPKQELAHLAESLINITTLKRRVSNQQETVGGPIDVAVLSKHEGFVWVKRKHYFPSELNPRYSIRETTKQSHGEA